MRHVLDYVGMYWIMMRHVLDYEMCVDVACDRPVRNFFSLYLLQIEITSRPN